VGQSRKSAVSPSDSRKSGSNPHTSSHGHTGAEPTKRSLSKRTSKQKGNCNASRRPVTGRLRGDKISLYVCQVCSRLWELRSRIIGRHQERGPLLPLTPAQRSKMAS